VNSEILSLRLNQPVIERVTHNCCARRDTKFAIDRAQIGVDRDPAEREIFGDFRVGLALRKQAKHKGFYHKMAIK
jgi:hypothetical protein